MDTRRVKPWRTGRKRGVHASHRHGFGAHMREHVWPSMGLVAFGRWVMLKLLRQADRPHYVALGAAIGIMVAFFPIVGTHTVIIFVLCMLLRASFLAALASSMISNPWTVGPIWAGSFHLGHWLLGAQPSRGMTVEHLNTLSWQQLADHFVVLAEHVLIPTTVGGAVLSAPLAMLGYGCVYWWLRRSRVKDLA
jgi:uncharacterized protein